MRRTWWTSLALAAVLLAGCSGDPEAREPDPSGSETPEPSATPPPLPEAATQETAEGAASFVDHYLDVMNYASLTGDTAPLKALSEKDCGGCQDYVEHYENRATAGGTVRGGEFSAGEISVAPYGTDLSLQTELTIAAGSVTETAESVEEEFAASSEVVTLIARFGNGSWRVVQFVPGELP
ncbi:MAG: DUF6318 family protein [Aeromicrobium sp.]|uniref:DUF6318 family protein n=1 Tax=Aeromicrobium sp. TaxID=1871063 RepID=UPI0026146121|nr:DUF6318 family protein [Aeromicrobium sp.]MDF1703383.1 DUF6318 family protein [Aeromicrobium sp.]